MSIKFLLIILLLYHNTYIYQMKSIGFICFYLLSQSILSQSVLKPQRVYKQDSIEVKEYNFEGFEKLLQTKNDTLYVYNFWATWCVPCVEELPYFEKVNDKYKQEKFKMRLVSLDFSKMVTSRLLPFIKKKNLKAEVILLNDPDPNNWIPKVDKNWSGAIPATAFVYGEQFLFFEKSFTLAELEKQIQEFFKK